MHRRNFIKAGAALTMLNGLGVGKAQDAPTHNWDRFDFGSGPTVSARTLSLRAAGECRWLVDDSVDS